MLPKKPQGTQLEAVVAFLLGTYSLAPSISPSTKYRALSLGKVRGIEEEAWFVQIFI